MIKKMKTNEGFEYVKLTPEEMKARGILGRLAGPCADFINPTRNGRGYSEQLWENVFNNPIMQEKIKHKVCFGELGHPAERTEIDIEKIAISLTEQPKKNDKGQLVAVFDILDTPNGRILKTLCDYGSTVGVSSRGQGDLITDAEGNEAVDPDTYECECWDVVLIPAVEEARMQYMKESLDTNKLGLKKALYESLSSANDEEKRVMEETLKDLNININEDADMKALAKDQKEIKKETEKAIKDLEKEKAEHEEVVADLRAGMQLDTPVEGAAMEEPLPTEMPTEAPVEEPLPEPVAAEPAPEMPAEEPAPVEEVPAEPTEPVAEALNEEVDDKEIKEIGKDQKAVAKETAKAIEKEEKEIAEIQDKIDTLKDGMTIPEKEPEMPVEEPIAESVEVATETTINEDVEDGEETDMMETPFADDTEEEKSEDEEKSEEEEITVDDAKDICAKLFELLDEIATDDNKELITSKVNEIIDSHDLSDEDWEELGVTIDDSEESEEDDAKLNEPEAELTVVPADEGSIGEEPGDIEVEDSNEAVEESMEATNGGTDELIKSLTEALQSKSTLEANFKALQEKLAVSDAKVSEMLEENKKLKESMARLAIMAKANKELTEKATKLEESVSEKDQLIADQKERIVRLVESRKASVAESTTLTESVNAKSNEVTTLTESVKAKDIEIANLNEQLNSVKVDSEAKAKGLTESLTKQTKLTEAYKRLATTTMNKYIEVKAMQIGLTSSDIKRKLGESYKLEDVDQVCEDLKSYQLNVSRLPFSIDSKMSVRVNEARNTSPVSRAANSRFDDDEVDDSLVRLAQIRN